MQHLEVSGAVRPIYGLFGVKRLICNYAGKRININKGALQHVRCCKMYRSH